jgi:small multidrug resistance family-3 protein
MRVTRSVLLFVVAAVAEIGGAWLVWRAVREQRGWLWPAVAVIMYARVRFNDGRFGAAHHV